jgi:hypothetical protein
MCWRLRVHGALVRHQVRRDAKQGHGPHWRWQPQPAMIRDQLFATGAPGTLKMEVHTVARAPNAGQGCHVTYAERDVGKEDGQWRRRGVGGWVGAFECHQPLRRKRNQGEGGGRGLLRCRHLHREPQHNHATLCADKQGKGAMGQALLGGGGCVRVAACLQ